MMENLENWINSLIKEDKLYKFYKSKEFQRLREEVLKEQHFECQNCKKIGKLTIVAERFKKSGVVHHVIEVRKNPNLALSKYYFDRDGKKQKQLIVLCNACHEKVHNRFEERNKPTFLNEEKW